MSSSGDQVFVSNGFETGHSAAGVVLNTWVHIALVRHNGTNRLYVNGTNAESDTQNYALSVTNNLISIGGAPGYMFFINGYMDDFRAVSGYAVYTGNFTPNSAQKGVYP